MLGIWYFLTFNLVYTMVYDQYLLGLEQMTRKMMVAEMSYQIFLVLVYVWYTKTELVY